MNDKSIDPTPGAGEVDILFDCPNCGKSLEIDARGAGYIVTCPDCSREVEVPPWEELQSASGMNSGLDETLAGLQARLAKLEKAVTADDQLLRRIGEEVQLIQSALDRINEIINARQP